MKSKNIKIYIGIMILSLVLSIDTTVSAGEINAAEQRAISAASQPFEYNGKTYVVNGSYVSQAKEKLSSENVDMSDSDAENYISQFNASHQELVEEGYCDEVSSGDNNADNDNKSENDGKATDKNDKKSSGDKKTNDKKTDDKKTDDKKTDDKNTNYTEKKHSAKISSMNRVFLREFLGEGKAQKATEEPQPTATANVWDDEEDAGTISADIEDKDIDYTYSDAVSIKYGNETYHSGYDFMKKITNIDVINTAWKVILILAVIAVLLQITYIFAIKKKKMKKRKFRTAIAVYSGLVIGLITVLIVSSFVLKFGYLNKSTIDRELMESDYFSGVTQTIREIGKRELKTAGYDEEIAEDIFKLSSVYIPEKQYIRNLLEKGRDKSEISTDKIYAALVQQINKGSKGENEKLIKKLEKAYKLGLSFKFGDGIYKCMKEFNNTFIIIMISSIVSLLLMAYLLSKMYGYKHKAVRVYSFAILASSLVSLVLVLITKVKNIEESIVVSPVFYQNFMTKYIAWNIKIGIYIGLIGILVGVALFFVKNYLHRLYVE